MNLLQGMLLGVLQGITEWLPISSSGQSMLFLINLLNITPEEAFSISVMLHLGSFGAVLVYFRGTLKDILYRDKDLRAFLINASIVSAVVGLPLYIGLRDLFSSLSGETVTILIGGMLIITGFILKSKNDHSRTEYTSRDAFYAGGAQGLAILPGISRSGTTIAALLLRGVNQETALSLSFLLALPAIFGLAVIETVESGFSTISAPIMLGVVSSFFVSLGAMHYFIALSRRIDFSGFVILIGLIAVLIPVSTHGIELII